MTTTTATTTSTPAGADIGNGNGGAPKATSGRAPSAVATRRLVAQRLRERREREEQLIVSAAEALGRRTAAREEAGAADRVLSTAIRDLVAMGFTVADIAEVLDVAVDQLGDQPSSSSGNGRNGKP